MANLPFAATTPTSIAAVGLKARDAEALAGFYRDVIGLAEISRGDGAITLGAGERKILVVEEDKAALPDDPREAGLFHTAFLLPSRADLGRWARYALERQVPLDGASNHLVSEAIYLSDPEENGIEIYADRPRESWPWEDGQVAMKTLRLDFDDLSFRLEETRPGPARLMERWSVMCICVSAIRRKPNVGGMTIWALKPWPGTARAPCFSRRVAITTTWAPMSGTASVRDGGIPPAPAFRGFSSALLTLKASVCSKTLGVRSSR